METKEKLVRLRDDFLFFFFYRKPFSKGKRREKKRRSGKKGKKVVKRARFQSVFLFELLWLSFVPLCVCVRSLYF